MKELSTLQSDCFVENEHCITDNIDHENFEFEQTSTNISVKGRLKEHVEFWEKIGANDYVLSVIKNGYRIPFVTVPKPSCIKNNKSAIEHSDFVSEAIKELLASKSIIAVKEQPTVVNPLTVSVNEKGKKRLVLDLRQVNPCVVKEKIKFDDWKVAQLYIKNNSFLFGFDL